MQNNIRYPSEQTAGIQGFLNLKLFLLLFELACLFWHLNREKLSYQTESSQSFVLSVMCEKLQCTAELVYLSIWQGILLAENPYVSNFQPWTRKNRCCSTPGTPTPPQPPRSCQLLNTSPHCNSKTFFFGRLDSLSFPLSLSTSFTSTFVRNGYHHSPQYRFG